ncbi:Signal peptide peptidase-like 2B, partial [Armadillidium nasatum]
MHLRKYYPWITFQHIVISILIIFMIEPACKAKEYKLNYGILKSRGMETNQEHKYCLGYYPSITKIPAEESAVKYSEADTEYLQNLCEDAPRKVNGLIVFADKDTNCSLIEEASEIEVAGGEGTIFVGSQWPFRINASNSTVLNMGFITNTSYQKIQELGENETILIGAYSSVEEDEFLFNYNLIVIWIMAEFSIIVGSYWSATLRHRLYLVEQGEAIGEPRDVVERPGGYTVREESYLKLTPKVVLILVFLMCIMLVCLWFLLEYLVYIIIALFCVASFFAIYCCLEPLVLKIPCGKCRTPYFNIYFIRGVLELRQIILILFSASLPIIWFIFRKEPYSWILQDILGIAFSINIMRVIRLPNLMICTLLLTLLVLYDIFFVFITPFITSSGTSIMVDVAQGGDSNEELPMVLKVPYFFYPEYYDVCKIRNYSLLGFGDILIPGFLISYVHSFDLKVGTPCRLYYLINIIAYGLGLLLTFVLLFVMQGAQPALFYLVPATLIPTVVIAAGREELAHMWTDKSPNEK